MKKLDFFREELLKAKGCLTEKRLPDYLRGSQPCQRESIKRQRHLHNSNGHQIITSSTKRKNDALVICRSSIPRDRQTGLSKRSYLPTTRRLAGVRLRGVHAEMASGTELRRKPSHGACITAQYSHLLTESPVWFSYLPCQRLVTLMLLRLPISHVFSST